MTIRDGVSAARLLEERGVTLLSLDLDDTLLDSDALTEMRVNAAAEVARRLLPDLDAATLARAKRESAAADPVTVGRMAALFATLGLDPVSPEAVAIREEYNRVFIPALEWVEGARAAVLRLRERYTLAIVTNGPTRLQWPKVRKFDIESLVDHIVVSGDVGHHKPDPAIFEIMLARAGVDASRAAHVGDSIHSDIAGARAAGMTAIWYPPKHREPDEVGEHVPDAVIDRLEELLGE